MLPHPETVIMRAEFEYQERLRDAARDRFAAGAQRSMPSPLARLRMVLYDATGWLAVRWRLAMRVRQPAAIAPRPIAPGFPDGTPVIGTPTA